MSQHLSRRRLLAAPVAAAALAGAAAVGIPAASQAAPASPFTVVAKNLDNPRGMSFGSDGALYVALAGRGGKGACATDPESGSKSCVGLTGSILRIKGKSIRRVVKSLPSVAGSDGTQATGPSDVILNRGRLVFTVQDTNIDKNGRNPFGLLGRLMGKLVEAPLGKGKPQSLANLAVYEAKHNPDRGAGAQPGQAIDSDPYAVAAYRGGYAIADAAGNDVLWRDRHGKLHTLAVFPTQTETAPAGTVGPNPTPIPVQSVPTTIAVGPDGALYVGELTGFPFQPGAARIWRVVPGHKKPTLYAKGFTNILGLAFDRQRRLLVLEIDKAGLEDQGKTPGEVIRLDRKKHRTVIASDGLNAATGIAVAPNGSIYVSIFGIFPSTGSGPHGEVVRLKAH